MPLPPRAYHWLLGNSSVINPETFTTYETHVNLPPQATLRRILINEPSFFWKRGSADYSTQEAYFLSYQLVYGNAEGDPVLYRTVRRIPSVIVSDAASFTEGVFSIHSAGALEVGMDQKCTRGGPDVAAIPVTLTWYLSSSGTGSERLQGQGNLSFRALYSVPIPP